jgi:hypothetical protein
MPHSIHFGFDPFSRELSQFRREILIFEFKIRVYFDFYFGENLRE